MIHFRLLRREQCHTLACSAECTLPRQYRGLLPLLNNSFDSVLGLCRLYFTEIELGSPSSNYYVQVDTGSDLLWVSCQPCPECPSSSDLEVTSLSYFWFVPCFLLQCFIMVLCLRPCLGLLCLMVFPLWSHRFHCCCIIQLRQALHRTFRVRQLSVTKRELLQIILVSIIAAIITSNMGMAVLPWDTSLMIRLRMTLVLPQTARCLILSRHLQRLLLGKHFTFRAQLMSIMWEHLLRVPCLDVFDYAICFWAVTCLISPL